MSLLQSSTDITQYNLNEIFHEILHKTPYDPDNPPNEDDEEMDHDGSDGSGDEDSDDTDYEEFVYPEDNIRDEYGLFLYVFVYVIVYF